MKFKNQKYSALITAIFLINICFISCKKFVEVPPAPNLISSTQVFADSTDASSAVLSLYYNMNGSGNYFSTYNGNITLYGGLSSDELSTNTGIPDETAAFQNGLSPSTSVVSSIWSDSYSLIYQTNAIIEGLTSSKGVDAFAKNQFIGEAKMIRAFCYFNLVNLYGGVPLAITTNYKVNAVLPRATVNDVYTQIISDLTSAQNLLSANYVTSGKVRVNKYAATALLAKVYLYQKQWVNAAAAATSVINSGLYSLEPNLNNVFLTGSREAILQILQPIAGYETAEGFEFVPSINTIIPSYPVDNFLLNAFEPGDQRKVNWISSDTISGTTYFFPFKYKLGNDGNNSPKEEYVIFRLSEQYLIRAEAEAETGGGTSAISDLNMIRNRAGLTNYTGATDSQSLEAAILHERQVEMFCEWGNRWYDLKRTSTVNTVMGSPGGECAAKGGSWTTNSQLYPIPLSQIQANPFLKQNPGY